MVNRRDAVVTLLATGTAAGVPGAIRAQPVATDGPALLRAGACVVMMRHAQTDPGVGDPANFRLDQCSTQRNLSEAGRAQARRVGAWFAQHKLPPRVVQTSAWCRCMDTAALAFGRHMVLPALNSTFGGRPQRGDSGDSGAQTEALRRLLAQVPRGQFDVWVTHQVNILALTGEWTSMGEAVVLNTAGTVLFRSSFE